MQRKEASVLVHSLFESWGPLLLRYAIRSGGTREWAEDLVQEAFMALYQRLRTGEVIENPKGWSLRFVRNQMAKHWRDRGRAGAFVGLEALDRVHACHADAREQLPDWDDLTRYFSVLSQREEEVVMLRLQALKYREIAQELGISANTVAPLLSRALKKLREAVRHAATPGETVWRMEDDAPGTLQ